MASQLVDRAEAPVSIYFGLTEGEAASLEVIAEAAIAYVSAIREMARAIDPALEVTVDIIDGNRSSLWLNTLTAIEQKLDMPSGRRTIPAPLGAGEGPCDYRRCDPAQRYRRGRLAGHFQ